MVSGGHPDAASFACTNTLLLEDNSAACITMYHDPDTAVQKACNSECRKASCSLQPPLAGACVNQGATVSI